MSWVRRGLLVLVVLLVGNTLVRSLVRSLSDHETRIRWRIEEMVEGFSKGRVPPVLRNVHADFMDDSSGATRSDLQGALLHLYLREKDRETKAFRLRAEVVQDEIRVTEGGPPRAEVQLHLLIQDPAETDGSPWWDARARTDWILHDGRWRLLRSHQVNHRDRR